IRYDDQLSRTMFSVRPNQYRSTSKNPPSRAAAGASMYFGNDCTAFLYASKNYPSLLLKCWNTDPLAIPNCAATSSTRAALYPRSAKCRISTSTIRARFASERGRGFPSRLICVGFARLFAIPSMAQLLPGSLTYGQRTIPHGQSIFQWLFPWALGTFFTRGFFWF